MLARSATSSKMGYDGLTISNGLVEHVHLLYYGGFLDEESLEIFGSHPVIGTIFVIEGALGIIWHFYLE